MRKILKVFLILVLVWGYFYLTQHKIKINLNNFQEQTQSENFQKSGKNVIEIIKYIEKGD